MFKEWSLDDGSGSAKVWIITGVILRSLSLVFAFGVTVVGLAVVTKNYHPTYEAVPVIVVSLSLRD